MDTSLPARSSSLRRAGALGALLASTAALAHWTSGPAEGTTARGSAIRVMVDPGHGGSDPGAIGNGLIEKEVNLAVATRLVELLEADTLDPAGGGEWEVQMTRTTDVFVSLTGRTNLANAWPADAFVSIHHNAFSSSAANGTETFSFAEGTSGADLRDDMQDEQLAAFGLTDRGSKTANFAVLRESNMPAALSEAGFLTSPVDSAVIGAPGFVEDSARAHLFALQRWQGFAPYVPTDGPMNYCTAKVSGLGCVPEMEAIGSASLTSSTPIRLACRNVVSQQFGLMIWGVAPGATPFFGGTLCIGSAPVRMPITFSNGFAPGDCSGRLETDIPGSYWQTLNFQPGDEIYAQYWFRDPFSTIAVGLSDGVRFTIAP
ncbi:MAG: N-acetylmuramoyl-L-alanine amidase [Planctomycetota bacterium]